MKAGFSMVLALLVSAGMSSMSEAAPLSPQIREIQTQVYLAMTAAELTDLTLVSETISASITEACYNLGDLKQRVETLPRFPETFNGNNGLNERLDAMTELLPDETSIWILCKGYQSAHFDSTRAKIHQSLVRIQAMAAEILKAVLKNAES